MKPAKGYYSLIQYCPDLARLEAANIGVLLFCPERLFLEARTVRGNRHARRFFGAQGHDWDQVDSFKLGLEERLKEENGNIKTVEDLEQFIALRANELQITQARPMRVEDPQRDLESLFQQLVGGKHRQTRGLTFRQFVDEKLSVPPLHAKLRTAIPVDVPVLDRRIEVPYGYLNGRFNLIQPVRFRGAGVTQAEGTACKYAIEGRSLFEDSNNPLGKLQLIVVGDFGPEPTGKQHLVARILNENEVRLFAATDLDRLVDEIKTTGKDISADARSTASS